MYVLPFCFSFQYSSSVAVFICFPVMPSHYSGGRQERERRVEHLQQIAMRRIGQVTRSPGTRMAGECKIRLYPSQIASGMVQE